MPSITLNGPRCAAIPVTVLFCGFLLTARGVLLAFKDSPPDEDVAMMAAPMALNLLWLWAGLGPALLVWFGYHHLLGQADLLDDEMALAAKDLAIALQPRYGNSVAV